MRLFHRAETRPRLKSDLAKDRELTLKAIEEAECLMLKHRQNAAFYENKIAFLQANMASAETLASTLHFKAPTK